MTTSFALLAHGDPVNALRANSVGALIALFCAALLPWCLVSAVRGQAVGVRALEKTATYIFLGFLALMLLRWALVPPAALTALSIAGLTALGARGPAGVVVTALLAYWAGLDLAFGALPLMEGRSCRLDPSLDASLDRGPARRDGKTWLPPWEVL
jgi:hypothetical protein